MIVALLSYAGQQVAAGAGDMADSVVEGIGEIQDWLRDGPLNLSASQVDEYLAQAQDAISDPQPGR